MLWFYQKHTAKELINFNC
jgi:synaptobrevin homolog YKT6